MFHRDVQTPRICLVFILSYSSSFPGGFLCFNIRCNELEDYEPKMVELEKAGMWENISKTTITYFKNEDLPKEALGFVFKVSRSE